MSNSHLSVPSDMLTHGGTQQQVPNSPSVASSNSSPPQAHRRDGKKFIGCSAFEDYELTNKLGEGTFGEVHKAVHRTTGHLVALKRILMHNEKEGLPITAIREIKLLKSLNHLNVVPLVDMIVRHEAPGSAQPPSVYMVFPYMDHDLTGLLENPSVHLRPEHIKLYLRQLLEGTAYLHQCKVMHRDMKTSNLLISNDGRLAIADFGLARTFRPDERRDMTKCVVTRWYRPPELLLGERRYTTAIDMWGAGCIFAEMLVGKPVFQGTTDMNQIEQVMRVCGSPNDSLWPGWRELPDCKHVEDFAMYPRRVKEEFAKYGEDAADLLDQLLQLDPRNRPDAVTALNHRYFTTAPFPARFEDMPKFEHSHEFDRRKQRQQQRQQQHQHQQQRQRPQGSTNPLRAPAYHQNTQQIHHQNSPYNNHNNHDYENGGYRDRSRSRRRDDEGSRYRDSDRRSNGNYRGRGHNYGHGHSRGDSRGYHPYNSSRNRRDSRDGGSWR